MVSRGYDRLYSGCDGIDNESRALQDMPAKSLGSHVGFNEKCPLAAFYVEGSE
jgi:hypothetical protein